MTNSRIHNPGDILYNPRGKEIDYLLVPNGPHTTYYDDTGNRVILSPLNEYKTYFAARLLVNHNEYGDQILRVTGTYTGNGHRFTGKTLTYEQVEELLKKSYDDHTVRIYLGRFR